MTNARRAGRADAGDDGEDQILGRHALRQRAIHGDAERLRLALPERLRRQHMRHLGAADAEGERAHRAVGRGVAVAADQQQPRLGQPRFRTDDVDDALARPAQAKVADAVLGAVARQGLDQSAAARVGDLLHPARVGRHVVVRHGEGAVGRVRLEPAPPQRVEGGGRALMHEVAIDIEQGLAVLALLHAVARPDLLEERARRGAAPSFRRSWRHLAGWRFLRPESGLPPVAGPEGALPSGGGNPRSWRRPGKRRTMRAANAAAADEEALEAGRDPRSSR